MKNLGFCIVGCGAIARTHVQALAAIPGARVTALVGRTTDAPRKLAGEFGLTDAGIYGSLPEALKNRRVDAVIVCTPSGNHLEPAVAAAEAGRHVIIEKPLEITPDRCDQIITACEKAGVKLATIFPSRFVEANRTLKNAVLGKRFGRIVLAETTCKWWRSQEYYDSGDWRGTWKLDGGGALMNQAIHNIDLLLWLMGPVTQVSAHTATLAHERMQVEDMALATLWFANGAFGNVVASTGIYPGFPKTVGIYGDRGSAVVEHASITTWTFADETGEDADLRRRFADRLATPGGAADPKAISHEYHARQLCEFVDAVRSDGTPTVDGREGRKSVALIDAMYRSAKSGQIVAVD